MNINWLNYEVAYHTFCDCCSHPLEEEEELYPKVDFYSHLERVISREEPFDDDVLNFNMTKSEVVGSSLKRVKKILQKILENKANFDLSFQIVLIKSLFCWQSQFNELKVLKFIVEFTKKHLMGFFTNKQSNSPDSNAEKILKKIGYYKLKNHEVSTLLFGIHSHSVDVVKFILEECGETLDQVYIGGMSAMIHYSILENHPAVTQYLLEKFSASHRNYIHLLEDVPKYGAIEIATIETNLESLFVILQFYAKDVKFELHIKQLVQVFKCVSYKLKEDSETNNLKLKLFKLLVERYKADLSIMYAKFGQFEESLFSIGCEYGNKEIFNYLFCSLLKITKNEEFIQDKLIGAIVSKMNRSFQMNIEVIQEMLTKIENKSQLYTKMAKFKKLNLLDPSEHDLKNAILMPPKAKHFCRSITNSYFIKHQLLIKYDIIPSHLRLLWLSNYISMWVNQCYGRPSHYSAFTLLRYLTFDQFVDLVVNYYQFLIENGYINANKKSSISWWYKLCENEAISFKLSQDDKKRLEAKLVGLYMKHKRNPLSLKMIARNTIRDELPSLSDNNLKSLKLPKTLLDYLRNE